MSEMLWRVSLAMQHERDGGVDIKSDGGPLLGGTGKDT